MFNWTDDAIALLKHYLGYPHMTNRQIAGQLAIEFSRSEMND